MKYIEQYDFSLELKDKLANNLNEVHPSGPVGNILFVQSSQVRSLFKQSKSGDKAEMLIHAAMGISGEAGELLDAVKKHVFYERELDMENMVEELGDILFYVQAASQVIGIPIEGIIAANVAKLNKRYPSGTYSNEQANARADKVSVPDSVLDAPANPTPALKDLMRRDRHIGTSISTKEEDFAAMPIMTSVHLNKK